MHYLYRTAFRRSSFLAPCIAVLALSVGAGVASEAWAQPATAAANDSASEHFGRGVAFYKDGDFTAAMVEFKRAYEIEPNYPVLYNLGQTSRELRDYANALTAFQKYLAEGAKASDQTHLNAHKDKVEGYITELKPKIAVLTLTANVEGAEVSVDDIVVGITPLDKPINVNAGRRKVSVTKSGYTPIQKFIDVGGTDQKTVPIELAQIGGPDLGHGHETPVTEKPNKGPLIAVGVTAVTVTAIMGAATIGLGVKSLSAKSDFQTALATFPGNGTDIEAKRSTAKTFALAADICGGVTIAGATVSVILFATLAGSGGSTSKDKQGTEPKAMIVPVVGPGTLGVAGTF